MFKNSKVKTKLLGGFSVVILLFCAAIAFSVFFLTNIQSLTAEQSMRAQDEETALKLKNEVGVLYSNQADVIINMSTEAINSFAENSVIFRDLVTQVVNAVDTGEETKWAKKLEQAADKYVTNFQKVISIHKNRSSLSSDELSKQFGQVDQETDQHKQIIFENIDLLIKSYKNEYVQAHDKVDATIQQAILVSIIVAAAAVLLTFAFSILMGRLIGNPLLSLAATAKRIAAGDLTGKIEVRTSKDEIGVLAESFGGMAVNLKNLILQVNETAQQVATSSRELTASAEQSAKGSQEVAESIGQVAAGAQTQEQASNDTSRAMKEMAAGVQRIAESSSAITEMSGTAAAKAKDGDESIGRVVRQMSAIRTSVDRQVQVVSRLDNKSREIGEIVGAMSNVAKQTNLLALNASIEAARAGEQGRGFAVVAGEVRKLAEQSSVSAEKITDLIMAIQQDIQEAVEAISSGSDEVQTGMTSAEQTGAAFRLILLAVDQVAHQVEEMSAVAQEMSASSEEVTASADDLAGIARETASSTQNVAAATEEQLAIMEEVTASAVYLSERATMLQQLIGRFKVQ